jgi:O-acetyl-ADP-ribose deacetylase (regulator of RNase III)
MRVASVANGCQKGDLRASKTAAMPIRHPPPVSNDADLVEQILALVDAEKINRQIETPRAHLRALLTLLPTSKIVDRAWPLLDALWELESRARPRIEASALKRMRSAGVDRRISVWQGDITQLSIDAIVNAANSGLTGCYQPFHACVDNAIHVAAGPRLRAQCETIMAARARPEPTATATLTKGYFLPAHHVIHTVGPIVAASAPSADECGLLARCYERCLGIAADHGLASLAFCGISTGVFGYPTSLAAPLAVATVRAWLARDARIEHVVFVTWSDADTAVYRAFEGD